MRYFHYGVSSLKRNHVVVSKLANSQNIRLNNSISQKCESFARRISQQLQFQLFLLAVPVKNQKHDKREMLSKNSHNLKFN